MLRRWCTTNVYAQLWTYAIKITTFSTMTQLTWPYMNNWESPWIAPVTMNQTWFRSPANNYSQTRVKTTETGETWAHVSSVSVGSWRCCRTVDTGVLCVQYVWPSGPVSCWWPRSLCHSTGSDIGTILGEGFREADIQHMWKTISCTLSTDTVSCVHRRRRRRRHSYGQAA